MLIVRTAVGSIVSKPRDLDFADLTGSELREAPTDGMLSCHSVERSIGFG